MLSLILGLGVYPLQKEKKKKQQELVSKCKEIILILFRNWRRF